MLGVLNVSLVIFKALLSRYSNLGRKLQWRFSKASADQKKKKKEQLENWVSHWYKLISTSGLEILKTQTKSAYTTVLPCLGAIHFGGMLFRLGTRVMQETSYYSWTETEISLFIDNFTLQVSRKHTLWRTTADLLRKKYMSQGPGKQLQHLH